jgi:hypothetical protein
MVRTIAHSGRGGEGAQSETSLLVTESHEPGSTPPAGRCRRQDGHVAAGALPGWHRFAETATITF